MPNQGPIPNSPPVYGSPVGRNTQVGLNGPGCMTSFGHSYLDQFAGTTNQSFAAQGGLANIDQSFFRQVLACLGLSESKAINYGLSTARLIYDNTLATGKGGWATVLQNISPINIRQSFALKAPWTNNIGLVLLCYGINDVLDYGLGSQAALYRKNYQEAWRTVISRCRAAAVYEALTDTNTVFSGGGIGGAHWSQVLATTANSGTGFARTATVGATATITIPADYDGGPIGIGAIGRKGATGGQATISLDGVVVDTFDTSNVTADSNNRNGTAVAGLSLMLTRRIKPQAQMAHTITITVTGIDGNFDYNFYQFEANEGNPILPVMMNKLRSYGGAANINLDSVVDDWNNALLELIREFPQPIEPANLDTVINQSQTNFAYINNRISYDGLHLSELGARYGASAVLDAYIRMSDTVGLALTTTNQRDTVGTGFPLPVAPTVANQYIYPLGLTAGGGASLLVASALYAIPVIFTRPCTLSNFVFANITATAGTVQLGLMHDKGNNLVLSGAVQGPLSLCYDWGNFTPTVANPKAFAIPAGKTRIAVPGLYWAIVIPQAGSALTCQPVTGGHPYINSSSFGTPVPINGACYKYTIGGGFTVVPLSLTPLTSVQSAEVNCPFVALSVLSVP